MLYQHDIMISLEKPYSRRQLLAFMNDARMIVPRVHPEQTPR